MDLNFILSNLTTNDWAAFMVLFLCGATVIVSYVAFNQDEDDDDEGA